MSWGLSETGDSHSGEIDEDDDDDQGSLFSFDFLQDRDEEEEEEDDDVVYVAVGKSCDSSMEALFWTLYHWVNPSTSVYLIHVFPETRYIPTPLGNLPIATVNPAQKENYMAQEKNKRIKFLERFLQMCSICQVKVDTILIESDMEAKAILDLIPALNIRKLVVGTSKSDLRKLRSRRGRGGIADQILHSAPEFCEVKIICEGKEMADHQIMIESPSPSPRGSNELPHHSQSWIRRLFLMGSPK